MLGLLNTVLTRGGSLLTYVKDGLVMANRFLTPPKLNFPAQGSAEFNGTSDYIQLNDAFSHTNHTIAAWVYANDDSVTDSIFDARDANDDGFRIVQLNDILYYDLNAGNLPASVSENNWYFAVGTYDGTTQKLYVDGSLISSQAISTTTNTTTAARIGARSHTSPASYWEGNLANVAIWNRALSSDEINSIMWKSYEALTSAESNGLQAWYSLDDITSPAASLANMEQLATDKNATIENKAAITAAINALS